MDLTRSKFHKSGIVELLGRVEPKTAIEVGCLRIDKRQAVFSDGWSTAWFAKLGYTLISIDCSAESISVAHSVLRRLELPLPLFVCGDAAAVLSSGLVVPPNPLGVLLLDADNSAEQQARIYAACKRYVGLGTHIVVDDVYRAGKKFDVLQDMVQQDFGVQVQQYDDGYNGQAVVQITSAP